MLDVLVIASNDSARPAHTITGGEKRQKQPQRHVCQRLLAAEMLLSACRWQSI